MYTMRHKNEVMAVFLKWKKMIETQTRRKIKRLRSDNGGEYEYDPFLQIYQDDGIVRHFMVRKTLQQNGVVERMNHTSLENVWCMLSNASLGKEFWVEAITYACHLINRLPAFAYEGNTPIEGKPATDYDSFNMFGCQAFLHVKKVNWIIQPRRIYSWALA